MELDTISLLAVVSLFYKKGKKGNYALIVNYPRLK
jgi:hypothetical protein